MTRTKSKNAEGTKAQSFENRIIDQYNGPSSRNHHRIIELRFYLFFLLKLYYIRFFLVMVQLQLRSGLN